MFINIQQQDNSYYSVIYINSTTQIRVATDLDKHDADQVVKGIRTILNHISNSLTSRHSLFTKDFIVDKLISDIQEEK